MPNSVSCITDRPIADSGADCLDNRRYAQGLINFIRKADTPITIGIQGGWGSGKTSLINIIQKETETPPETEDGGVVCVVVNAWEHSLLKTGGGKGEIVISLLSGLIMEINDAIKDLKGSGVDEDVIAQALNEKNGLSKALSLCKNVGMAVGLTAVKMVAQTQGIPLTSVGAGQQQAAVEAAPASYADVVRELKNTLKHAISTVTQGSRYRRFVCFIDDLDRVPPATAVEILDILKNIFDIAGCIFVLAIDYEVVVKGLEDKYGAKTEKNEREFRQYFEKIIQVPFTMPVGSYKSHLKRFINNVLVPMGFDENTFNSAQVKVLSDVANWTTEGLPRAVKRIINTMSLLLHIGAVDDDGSADAQYWTVLFIVVALHINFPEICRCLMIDRNFTKWNDQKCRERFRLPEEVPPPSAPKKEAPPSDDDWKPVVRALCSKNQWLADRAESVLQVLLALRKILNESSEIVLGEKALETLDDALDLVRVVSMDLEMVQDIDDTDVRKDRVTQFFKQLHGAIRPDVPWAGLPEVSDEYYAKQDKRGKTRTYEPPLEHGLSPLETLSFTLYEKTRRLSLVIKPAFDKKFPNSEDNRKNIQGGFERLLPESLPAAEVEHDLEGHFYISFNGYSRQDLSDFADNFDEKRDELLPLMTEALQIAKEVCEPLVNKSE